MEERFRATARRLGVQRKLRAGLRKLGFDLLRRHFYSPVPDVDALPPEIWTRESELRGVQFDLEASLRFVEHQLSGHITEYTPPRTPTGRARDFYLENPGPYRSVDAETLYAMVRRFTPTKIIELGSGFSTLVIADARARNGEQDPSGHVVYDPYPRAELLPALEQVADVRKISAADVPMAEFEALRAGDLLFVDTSHTVKIGGEVNRVILDVLPSLAPGVLVHVHDIFLPFEYPRMMPVDNNLFFSEQYLLQAFLAFNPGYEVLFGAYALQRKFPEALARLVPSAGPETSPAAFWLRRTENGSPAAGSSLSDE
jgi:hypothetical protein